MRMRSILDECVSGHAAQLLTPVEESQFDDEGGDGSSLSVASSSEASEKSPIMGGTMSLLSGVIGIGFAFAFGRRGRYSREKPRS